MSNVVRLMFYSVPGRNFHDDFIIREHLDRKSALSHINTSGRVVSKLKSRLVNIKQRMNVIISEVVIAVENIVVISILHYLMSCLQV